MLFTQFRRAQHLRKPLPTQKAGSAGKSRHPDIGAGVLTGPCSAGCYGHLSSRWSRPLCIEIRPVHSKSPSTAMAEGDKQFVLVADDTPDHIRVVNETFHDAYEVWITNNEATALETREHAGAERDPADCAHTCHIPPGRSGSSACCGRDGPDARRNRPPPGSFLDRIRPTSPNCLITSAWNRQSASHGLPRSGRGRGSIRCASMWR